MARTLKSNETLIINYHGSDQSKLLAGNLSKGEIAVVHASGATEEEERLNSTLNILSDDGSQIIQFGSKEWVEKLVLSSATQDEIDKIEAAVGLSSAGTYVEKEGTHYLDSATTVEEEINILDQVAAAIQAELDKTQVGAGLSGDGSYVKDASATYISDATSLMDADEKLDAELARVEKARKDITGQEGDTYAVNTTTPYISGATNMNDADVKLANALSGLQQTIDELDAEFKEEDNTFFGYDIKQQDGLIVSGVVTLDIAETADAISGVTGADDHLTSAIAVKDYVKAKIDELDKSDEAVTGKVVKAVSEEDGIINVTRDFLADTDVKINKISTGLPTNVREAYQLVNGNNIALGSRIDIFKDASLHNVVLDKMDAEINTATGDIIPGTTGKTAMCFVYHYEDDTYALTKVDVSKFLEEAEFKDGLIVNENGEVRVKIDDTSEKDFNNNSFLTVVTGSGNVNGGVAINGIEDQIQHDIQQLSATTTDTTKDGFITVKVDEWEGQLCGVTVTDKVQPISAASADNKGIAEAWDVKQYIDAQAGASNTKVVAGESADTTAHMTINSAKSESDSSVTYTINLKDIEADKIEMGVAVEGNSGCSIASTDMISAAIQKAVDYTDARVEALDAASANTSDKYVNFEFEQVDGLVTKMGVSGNVITTGDALSNVTADTDKLASAESVKEFVDTIVSGLDATVSAKCASGYVSYEVAEADGKLSGATLDVTYAEWNAETSGLTEGIVTDSALNEVIDSLDAEITIAGTGRGEETVAASGTQAKLVIVEENGKLVGEGSSLNIMCIDGGTF